MFKFLTLFEISWSGHWYFIHKLQTNKYIITNFLHDTDTGMEKTNVKFRVCTINGY